MSDNVKLGQLIQGEVHRDAIHIAIAPVTAGQNLDPGEFIAFSNESKDQVVRIDELYAIGIVDPFLNDTVRKGERFYMFLKPNTVTGMRHHWSHPAFAEEETGEADFPTLRNIDKEYSIKWMTDWAVEHTPGNYYDDEEPTKIVDRGAALSFAIDAGRRNHIGPYESARDYIDNQWWDHWENITGEKAGGRRDEYFTCSC